MKVTCPHCLAGTCVYGRNNLKRRNNHKGHVGYREPRPVPRRRAEEVCVVKKPASREKMAPDRAPDLCDLGIRWENLWEFLTVTKWDDDSKRTPGTVMVMYEDGWFKAMLNDKDGQRIAFCSGDTLEAVIDAVELGLKEDKHDWRKSKPFKR